MTPSQWHDDARNRDAGHDAMQIAVFDYLQARNPPLTRFVTGDSKEFLREGVYFERPFRRGDQIVAWGDVVEVWREPAEYNSQTAFMIYEIKPTIYSVGAVVRQCVSLELTAKLCGMNRHSGRQPVTSVIPVVMASDPKLAMLRHVFWAAAWDGERLTYE